MFEKGAMSTPTAPEFLGSSKSEKYYYNPIFKEARTLEVPNSKKATLKPIFMAWNIYYKDA